MTRRSPCPSPAARKGPCTGRREHTVTAACGQGAAARLHPGPPAPPSPRAARPAGPRPPSRREEPRRAQCRGRRGRRPGRAHTRRNAAPALRHGASRGAGSAVVRTGSGAGPRGGGGLSREGAPTSGVCTRPPPPTDMSGPQPHPAGHTDLLNVCDVHQLDDFVPLGGAGLGALEAQVTTGDTQRHGPAPNPGPRACRCPHCPSGTKVTPGEPCYEPGLLQNTALLERASQPLKTKTYCSTLSLSYIPQH